MTTVVRAGRTYEVLETNDLGEVVMATPAISDGLLVMRSAQHVYGLGEGEPSEVGEVSGDSEAESEPGDESVRPVSPSRPR